MSLLRWWVNQNLAIRVIIALMVSMCFGYLILGLGTYFLEEFLRNESQRFIFRSISGAAFCAITFWLVTIIAKAYFRSLDMAMYDNLTGAYSRWFKEEAMRQCISRTARNHEDLCLYVIDLNLFKQINDRHGHDAGDEVLKAMKTRIAQSMLRTCQDFLIRDGGDEFIIICTSRNPQVLYHRLQTDLNHGVIVYYDARFISINASVGFACLSAKSEMLQQDWKIIFDALHREADSMMYENKKANR